MKLLKSLPILLLAGILASCGMSSTTEKAQTPSFHKVVDAEGNKIQLKQKPKKIVSLIPSNTEILFALGLGKEVKGVTAYDDYPKAAQKITKVVSTEVDTEKIIAMKPDLVLGHESSLNFQKDAYKQLEEAKIPLFVVKDAQTLQSAEKTIEQIGQLTGTTDKAKAVVQRMEKQKASLQTKAAKQKKQPTVWIEISNDLYTAGDNTFMNEMLDLAGGKNIVTKKGYPKYNEEQVIKADPDVIITTYPNAKQEIAKRKAWKNIRAVKNARIYSLDANKLSRPGPRLVEGAEEIYQAIYPK
ncbi:Vitamin B12-binding protein precursor [Listeria grayi]|uniref:ABC transporter substrate-binding protein n=1 Tax=Listeria grayi FSL F6-1183 TaxID=1265827 RepID=A0A829R6G6_LISGR|nr:ABC transporter substrate-binding protein [Listeria grayi]EUJ27692.1 ABC transporter substrate-binding protein [Listeria grayi FSL F6-1183]VEI34960.1 Vitamin B12-binding protein precursor [Listeria grayi]